MCIKYFDFSSFLTQNGNGTAPIQEIFVMITVIMIHDASLFALSVNMSMQYECFFFFCQA